MPSDDAESLNAKIMTFAAGRQQPIRALDLAGLANPAAIHQALSRLTRSGVLLRRKRGEYQLAAGAAGARRAGDRASRHIHLLEAATPLFARRGFHGVSMRDIAKASGLQIATLYNYFPDKDALYRAVLEVAWEEGARRTLEIEPSSTPPRERLEVWIRNVIEFHYEQSPAALLRDRDLLIAPGGEQPNGKLLAASAERSRAVRELITQLDPPLARQINPRRIGELIYGLCYGVIKFRPALALVDPERSDLSRETITRDVLCFVSAALGWPAAEDRAPDAGKPQPHPR